MHASRAEYLTKQILDQIAGGGGGGGGARSEERRWSNEPCAQDGRPGVENRNRQGPAERTSGFM